MKACQLTRTKFQQKKGKKVVYMLVSPKNYEMQDRG
jgi:hypothetical protein